ncbi:hypothetical protein DSO57_1010099 [Entomophthora muscae]|uniref:Uncharacterized protein n=1 Tax=Entomophthora muscae TaxID=34485 RepID=A0ACC2U4Q1_9FUNG|nr:hypothetical protein DSO57_1010099 [Entomophthora muscae]
MRGILFLSWFLAYFLTNVYTLENPTPTTDWYNSSPDDAHQKEALANGWFKYTSGHWGCKFNYGCLFASPPTEPTLVRPYTSFYLLMYLVGYYLLGQFSSMFGRFAYLGQLGHLAMVTGFAAQHDDSKSKGSSDDWLEVQAAWPHDLWPSGDPNVTPEDAQFMGKRLTWLIVSEGLLIQDDRNTSSNDEAMKMLSLDRQMEFIPTE